MLILSEQDAARLGVGGAKGRTKHGRSTRPDLPSAGRSAPTGLTSLIAGKGRVWSVEYRVDKGFRLYVINEPTYDTGFCPTESAACAAAKSLL